MNEPADSPDPYNLHRFVLAQAGDYARALSEVRAGEKRSHWMWYIFPQIAGLGFSTMSVCYSIQSLDEARAYLVYPVLGARLIECFEALLDVKDRSAFDIFGSPDDRKLKSSATVFALVSPEDSVFHRVLEKYFDGEMDQKTLRLLGLDRPQG
jgi:uncharacterized protein (DUF1810 family)